MFQLLTVLNMWTVSSIFESIFMLNKKSTLCRDLLNKYSVGEKKLRYNKIFTIDLCNIKVKLIEVKREKYLGLCYIKYTVRLMGLHILKCYFIIYLFFNVFSLVLCVSIYLKIFCLSLQK